MTTRNRRTESLPILRLEIEHADGLTVLSPNEAATLVAGGGVRLLNPIRDARDLRSVISAEPALLYRSENLEIPLTSDELCGLLSHDLRPDEVAILDAKYGDAFEWHDDFYDQHSWEALQPMGVRDSGRPAPR